MPLKVVKRSREGAVHLTALKQHLRLVVENGEEYTTEDNLLQEYILAATDEYEGTYKVALLTQDLQWQWEDFQTKIEIPRPPLQSVTSVTYIDSNGQEQTVADSNYTVVTSAYPGFVLFNSDYSFPDLSETDPYPVRIDYKAGYGADASKVPSGIRVWLMNIIGTLYKNRDSMLIGYGTPVSVHDLRKQMSGLIAGQPKAARFG